MQLDKAGRHVYTTHAGTRSAEMAAVLKKSIPKSRVCLRAVLGVVLLTDSKGYVAVLDHVLNLLTH